MGIIGGVSSIIYKISPYLVRFAEDELMLQLGFQDELKKILNVFNAMGSLLQDAEAWQIQDMSVTRWLLKVQEIACETDDFLEDFILDPQPGFFPDGRPAMVSLLYYPFYSYPKFCILRLKFGSRLRNISDRLAILGEEGDRYPFCRKIIDINQTYRITYSHVDAPSVVGREEDMEVLVEMLVKVDHTPPVSVLSIVGVGGIGKTTLTQLVYNHERVKQHFEKRLWVCVSDNFNVREILTKILEEGGVSCLGITDLQSLSRKFILMFREKRYLLILDDVWNEEYIRWDKLMSILNWGAKGSKIIVTTTKLIIAESIGSYFVHKLDCLQDDACWMVFEKIAFGRRRIEEDVDLKNIGRNIIEKCRGVPLAVKTLANMLRDKSGVQCWNEVVNSHIWGPTMWLPQSADIVPALLLSYLNLPPPLKTCFGYCSIFPKYSKLFKDELVNLWAAQGFILEIDGREIEDVGGEYFYKLLDLGFFQEQEEDADEERTVICCKMHHLFHDLAKFVTSGQCSSVSPRDETKGSFVHWRILELPSSESFPNNLRTLMLPESQSWFKSTKLDFNQLICLRVLSLTGAEIDESRLGDIGKLVHLRYLDLSWTRITALPNSLAKLVFLIYLDLSWSEITDLPRWVAGLHLLQTIKLMHCKKLKCLQSELDQLERLRHLDIRGVTNNLEDLPAFNGNLRTLTMFPAAKGQDGSNMWKLGPLNCLWRGLEITKLENVRSRAEAVDSQLEKKIFLRRLCYEWSGKGLAGNHEEVLEGLCPPSGLRRLAIKGYGGTKLPSWINNGARAHHIFSNLTHLELADCYNCDYFPASLPVLRSLVLENCVNITFLPTGVERILLRKMPTRRLFEKSPTITGLRYLAIESDDELTQLPDQLLGLTSLLELSLSYCFNLKTLPPKMSSLTELKVLSINRCSSDLKNKCSRGGLIWRSIAHIPNIIINS